MSQSRRTLLAVNNLGAGQTKISVNVLMFVAFNVIACWKQSVVQKMLKVTQIGLTEELTQVLLLAICRVPLLLFR